MTPLLIRSVTFLLALLILPSIASAEFRQMELAVRGMD